MSEAAPERADGKSDSLRGVLPAGTTLRGYELKSILGQGAFGITYRARDLTLNRDVAIKEYLPTTLALREGRTTVLPRSPDHAEQFAWGRERFLDEARTLAKLDRTPAIVRVHDYLEANGTAYMVMGLVEGETLNRRLMRERRLTPEAVDRLLFPLLDGLEEVHAIGFLHRDIKPANIMVDARGRPTLIDFGAARAAMAGRSTTMTAIFTPGYAAAEQYTSAELGPWTDVYGLAATLYHAITGTIPPSSIERILRDTFQPLGELKPEGFAPELLAGIDAGMARHVDDRPQSIIEWRQVLRTGERQSAALEATQIEHKPGRLARAASRTRKSGVTLKGPALWGAAAAAAIVLAGGGWLAFTAGSPSSVSTIAQNLSAEQLEQALTERRKADALAAEKRKLEEEARLKAEVDTEAKRQADAELEQARQARQKAEQELAELKARIAAQRQNDSQQRDQAASTAQREAEEAAQRKAEADAAALRQAEEEARKKAEVEAEAKRQADEALAKVEAERQQAERDARAKADAEQAALRQASEEAQRKAAQAESVRQAEADRQKAEAERQRAEAERLKAEADAKARADAEAAEKALRLDQQARERLQLALSSLGFDTRGTDGIFGPRTREMIAGWQKARNQPATGFLSAAQQEALLKEAAPALAKQDEQKKAEDEAKTRVTAPTPSVASSGVSTASDGLWRGTYQCGADGTAFPFALNLETRLSNGSATWYPTTGSASNDMTASISISVEGSTVTAVRRTLAGFNQATVVPLSGRFEGNSIRANNNACTLTLTRGGPPDASALPQASAIAVPPVSQRVPADATRPGNTAYDGTYSGELRGGLSRMMASVQIANGRGSGTLTMAECSPSQFSLTVEPTGKISGEGYLNCFFGGGQATQLTGSLQIWGEYQDRSLRLSINSGRAAPVAVTLRLGGTPSPALASPDGRWRGIYSCEATGLQLGGTRTQPFTLDIDMRLADGMGTWRGPSPSIYNGGTFDIRIAVDRNTASLTRSFYSAGSAISGHASLKGRYDGSTISAAGTEQGADLQCSLNLARA